eukprot:gene5695-5933_t
MARVKPRQTSKRKRYASSDEESSDIHADDSDSAGEQQQQSDTNQQAPDAGIGWTVIEQDTVMGVPADAAAPASEAAVQPGRRRQRKQAKPAAAAPTSGAMADEEAEDDEQAADGHGRRARYNTSDDEDKWAFASEEDSEVEDDAGEGEGVGGGGDAADDNEAGLELFDHNDSHCKVCGSDADADKLLCCEACPFVFHLACLDPPLTRVPRGTWICPVCSEADTLLDDTAGVEKVLAVRAKAPDPADPEDQQNQQEFYVKFKDRSYLHAAWISQQVLEKAANIRVVGQANPVATKLKRFWRDHAAAEASGELAEALETGQLVNGINPAWVQVDVVLAQRAVRSLSRSADSPEEVEYLVAWKELPLEQATWETAADLADFSAEIAAFHSNQTSIAAEAAAREVQQAEEAPSARGTEQVASAHVSADKEGQGNRKFETTPDFVAGGPLHPYQLEGLNWLYHKAQTGDNVVLADEMGLGKTIQTIAFLGALWKDCVRHPHLVVVPLTTLANWERELATWAPFLRVVSLKGSAAARGLLLDHCFYTPVEAGSSSSSNKGKAGLQVGEGGEGAGLLVGEGGKGAGRSCDLGVWR